MFGVITVSVKIHQKDGFFNFELKSGTFNLCK